MGRAADAVGEVNDLKGIKGLGALARSGARECTARGVRGKERPLAVATRRWRLVLLAFEVAVLRGGDEDEAWGDGEGGHAAEARLLEGLRKSR